MVEKDPQATTDLVKQKQNRILVCIDLSPAVANLISSAKRMADILHAKWYAVHVNEPRMLMLPEAKHKQALNNLRLAEKLERKRLS